MEQFITFFKTVDVMGIPLSVISIAILIIILAFLLRKLLSHVIINYLGKLVQRTETDIDELILKAIDGPLRLAIVGIGFYFVSIILAPYLSETLQTNFAQWLQLFFLIVICWFLFKSADILIIYLQRLANKTPTELDDLLLPYLRKVIRIALIVLLIIKMAEIVLGMSVTALLGLLGGMGLTLGLVFKDIIANWFGCAVIYMDNLFKEGDWVMINDGKIVDADVEEIGLRSTRFRNFDKTVSIVPNGLIAQSIVKNWSRMYKRRVKFNFKIDGIGAEKLSKILEEIRAILTTDEDVHQEFHMVNFREIDGNSRIIRLYYFTKTTVWAEHEKVRENINLKILQLLEARGVDRLSYTIVDLSDDRPNDYSVEFDKN